jgi:hypothetical protein
MNELLEHQISVSFRLKWTTPESSAFKGKAE